MTEPQFAIHEPPPEYVPLANVLAALREWRYLCGARQGEYPILVSEVGFGIQETEERIRRGLASGKIRSYFPEGSEFTEFPRKIWENDTAWNAIRVGARLRIVTETTEAVIRPLVKNAKISLAEFSDEGQPSSPSAEATESAPPPPRPTAPQAETTDSGQDDGSPLPYLDFMQRTAAELHLDGSRRSSKKTLRDHLK
jgi:hypothetical protein